MDKLTLAHEYALKIIETHKDMFPAAKCVSNYAFEYAEAMLAEEEKRRDKSRPDVLEEWQPDWSQAPDDRVQYFAVDENGMGGWYVNKPILCHDHWYWGDFEERMGNDCYDYAPSFNYQGDWKESLRERP